MRVFEAKFTNGKTLTIAEENKGTAIMGISLSDYDDKEKTHLYETLTDVSEDMSWNFEMDYLSEVLDNSNLDAKEKAFVEAVVLKALEEVTKTDTWTNRFEYMKA